MCGWLERMLESFNSGIQVDAPPDHAQYWMPKPQLARDCRFDAHFRLYGRIPLNDYMSVNLRPVRDARVSRPGRNAVLCRRHDNWR